MAKYEVWKTVVTDWMMVVDVDDEGEVLDAVSDGEWEFVESDYDITDIVKLDGEGAMPSLLIPVSDAF
jgi:hypothetical protein